MFIYRIILEKTKKSILIFMLHHYLILKICLKICLFIYSVNYQHLGWGEGGAEHVTSDRMKAMFYLMIHSIHFIHGYMVLDK